MHRRQYLAGSQPTVDESPVKFADRAARKATREKRRRHRKLLKHLAKVREQRRRNQFLKNFVRGKKDVEAV